MEVLVSVIVITYNSSQYILETLESVKSQTYRNLELILSDDCSTDDTVDICRRWLKYNNRRFKRSEILTVSSNTGISANLNRGLKSSKGLWIKYCAGDDILSDQCIGTLLTYASNSKNAAKVVNGLQYIFTKPDKSDAFLKSQDDNLFYADEISPHDQYEMLLRHNRVGNPPLISHEVFKNVGLFDEQIPLLEDYPFWLKITNYGYKIYCSFKPVSYYRVTENSVSGLLKKDRIILPIEEILIDFQQKYIIRKLPKIEAIGMFNQIFVRRLIIKLGNNSKNRFLIYFYKLIKKTNPFSIYHRLLRIFGINYVYEKYL